VAADHWSSENTHCRDQLAAWRRRLMALSFEKEVEAHEGVGFSATSARLDLGASIIVTSCSTPQRISLVRANGRSVTFGVQLCIGGSPVVEQAGRSCRLEPGDLVLIRADQPHMKLMTEPWRMLTMLVPGQKLLAVAPSVSELTLLPIRRTAPFAALSAQYLEGLANHLQDPPPTVAAMLEAHALDLIALTLAGLGCSKVMQRSSHRASSFFRVRLLVESFFRDPSLTPERLAAKAGLSKRTLRRLFEESGTTAASYLRERRLRQCATMLADPLQAGRSVSDIGYMNGFSDPSHFSRVFRDRFGATPQAYRRGCLQHDVRSPTNTA
jgi:AraC-like DNA-binding protein